MNPRPALLTLFLCVLCGSFLSSSILAVSPVYADESIQPREPDSERSERWVRDLPLPVSPTFAATLDGAVDESGGIRNQAPLSPGTYTYVFFTSYRSGSWDVRGVRGYQGSVNTLAGENIAGGPGADLGPKARPATGIAAFYSDRSGNYEVYTASWGETGLEQLTNHPGYDGQPAWSPDGQFLVFVSTRDGNQELYLLDMISRSLSRLTYSPEAEFAPAFSPDGSKLVWIRAVNDTGGVLYQSDPDGANATALTQPLRYLQHPAYAPDGAKIAFDFDANSDGWNDLAVMAADGSGLQVMRYAQNLSDLWAGSWASSTDLLVTTVTYVVHNQNLYVNSMCIETYWPASDSLSGGPCQLDRTPHATMIDISIPETSVLELPRYMRAGEQSVTIVAQDRGPAYVTQVDLQWSIGSNAGWSDLQQFYLDSGGVAPVQLSHSVDFPLGPFLRFRSRGIDDAGHVEAWPSGDGDTSTTTYRSQLSGAVIDNRGAPVPGASVYTQPVLDDQADADSFGNFHRYVPGAIIAVEVGKAGFGAVPTWTLDMSQDAAHTWVLPPLPDLVDNGGFEAGHAQWSDDPCAKQAVHDVDSSQHSLLLGLPPLCDDLATLSSGVFSADYPQMQFDADGALHAVWSAVPPEGGAAHIYYAERPAGQAWGAPLRVDGGLSASVTLPSLDVGADGSVGVAWILSRQGANAIYFTRRSSEGVWSAVETVIADIYIWSALSYARPLIAIAATGEVHLLYKDQYGLHYLNRAADGSWFSPLDLSSYTTGVMDLTSDDVLHVVYYSDNPSGLVYRTRSPAGMWSAATLLPINLTGTLRQAISNEQGTLHFLTDAFEYVARYATGGWSPVAVISDAERTYYDASMAVAGETPLFAARTDGGLFYRRGISPQLWSSWLPFELPSVEHFVIAASPTAEALLHIVGTPGEGVEVRSANVNPLPDTATCSIGQRLTIPLDMTKPTLSYMRKLVSGETTAQERFIVAINHQTVYSTSLVVPGWDAWKHQWLDLSPWAGQTVTITLSLRNDLRHGYSVVGLDDVAVGPWLTPRVERITPLQAGVAEPFTLIIEGENFIDPVQVFLGGVAASSVTWQDEHRIEARFAAGLGLGIHRLQVINASGHETYYRGAMNVGEFLYLPFISRK